MPLGTQPDLQLIGETNMIDIVNGVLTLFQIILGSASIYSLLINAVEAGLFFMFLLFVLISFRFLLKNKASEC
jgi:hypothetical protein